MNKLRIGILLVFALCFSYLGNAQSTASLRINEVLVDNQNNLVDSYGERVAWIEIYNSSYATVNMEGCYITNDVNNPTLYRIPKGDINTKIRPRQYAIFWADNTPNRGAFYLNFGLNPDTDNYLALYDTDGKTLIDEVTIPASVVRTDLSYGRITDGLRTGKNDWEIKGIAAGDRKTFVTPGANNVQDKQNTKVLEFQQQDSIGLGMAAIAMSAVFLGLVLLFLSFKLTGIIAIKIANKREMKENKQTSQAAKASASTTPGTDDEIVAIAMALHAHFGVEHDVEHTVLTFNEVGHTQAPWSSKIFGMRQK